MRPLKYGVRSYLLMKHVCPCTTRKPVRICSAQIIKKNVVTNHHQNTAYSRTSNPQPGYPLSPFLLELYSTNTGRLDTLFRNKI